MALTAGHSFYSNDHRDIHVEYSYFYQLVLVCRGPIFEICYVVHVNATSVHETLTEIHNLLCISYILKVGVAKKKKKKNEGLNSPGKC